MNVKFFYWIAMPLWIVILIVASCFVSVVNDSYETKFNVIRNMWIVFGKNLLNNQIE